MASKIEICNWALSMVNARNIASLTENSSEAEAVNTAYTPILDSMLEQHPWGFATKTSALAEIDEDPLEFGYVYALPADCVKVQGTIHKQDEQPQFKVRERKFYSDEAEVVLEYTYRVTNTGLFTPSFVTALASAIAVSIAPRLGAEKLKQSLMIQSQGYLRSAQASDANTTHKKSTMNRTFVNVRK